MPSLSRRFLRDETPGKQPAHTSGRVARGGVLPFMLTIACAMFYAVWLARLALERHNLFQSGATDLGIYHQLVWLISRGKAAYSTLGQWHMLGDHFCPILYLLAPVMWIHPNLQTLLWLQAAALAVPAIILFTFAQWKWGSSWNALGLSVAYLCYGPASLLALDDFHPEVLAIPFLLLAVLSVERKRTAAYWMWVCLALCCKESVALVVIFMGLCQIGRRQWSTGGVTVLVGVFAAYLITQVVIPWFRGGSYHQTFFYCSYGDTLPKAAMYLLRHPEIVVRRFLEEQSLLYIGQLVLPLAFLPLLSPLSLLPALPTLMLNVMSDWPATRVITSHYTALIIPFLWLAIIHGLTPPQRKATKSAGSLLFRRMRPATLGVLLLLVATNLSNVKGFTEQRVQGHLRPVDKNRIYLLQAAVQRIPPDVSVSSSFFLIPHLSARQEIYWFPAPFRKFDWRKRGLLWPLEDLDPVILRERIDEGRVSYILLDTVTNFSPYLMRGDFDSDLDAVLQSKRYRKIMEEDGIVLLQRTDTIFSDKT